MMWLHVLPVPVHVAPPSVERNSCDDLTVPASMYRASSAAENVSMRAFAGRAGTEYSQLSAKGSAVCAMQYAEPLYVRQ